MSGNDYGLTNIELLPVINSLDGIGPMVEKILRLEDFLISLPDETKLHIEPVHYYADGIYGREITIPAGTLLTGKIHKFEHMNFITEGDITVWTDDGMKRIVAPAVIISQPGIKRVGYAHAQTKWVTVHAVPGGVKVPPEVLESALVCSTFQEYKEFAEWAEKIALGEA